MIFFWPKIQIYWLAYFYFLSLVTVLDRNVRLSACSSRFNWRHWVLSLLLRSAPPQSSGFTGTVSKGRIVKAHRNAVRSHLLYYFCVCHQATFSPLVQFSPLPSPPLPLFSLSCFSFSLPSWAQLWLILLTNTPLFLQWLWDLEPSFDHK